MNRISKYILGMILITVVIFTITGCGNVKDNKENNDDKQQTSENTDNNNQEKNYTDEMYRTAIRNYYTDNEKDYKVEAINISSRENGYVTAQVYLIDSNNKKGYEKYEINEKSGKGKSESNSEIDILKYLEEIYNTSKDKSDSDSPTDNRYSDWDRKIAEKIIKYEEIAKNRNTSEGDFYMPIEDVFQTNGNGIVMTGRIKRGSIKVGDTVDVIGYNKRKTGQVISIEQFRTTSESATMNDNIGVVVSGIESDDVKRGSAIVKCDSMRISKKIKAKLLTGPSIERDQKSKSRYLYIATAYVGCKIDLEELKNNMEETVTIDLEEEMPVENGMVCYLMIAGRTVGVVIFEEVL